MRHNPLGGSVTDSDTATVTVTRQSAGKVTLLGREVAALPLATFCDLLATADPLTAEDCKARFVAYCQTAPYCEDWRLAWRDFMATRGIDHGAALRARIEARAGALRHLRPLSKSFPAALRRVLRSHAGHTEAFERAIAGAGNFSARYEKPPWLPLSVEVLPVSPAGGVPAVSVTHYGEAGGDLMRDPEIIFAVVSVEAWLAYECRQDFVGCYSCAFRNDIFHPSISAGINRLASVWSRNLGGQDWTRAACVRANLGK